MKDSVAQKMARAVPLTRDQKRKATAIDCLRRPQEIASRLVATEAELQKALKAIRALHRTVQKLVVAKSEGEWSQEEIGLLAELCDLLGVEVGPVRPHGSPPP